MIINKFKYAFILSVLGIGLLASETFAATISLTADKQSANIGDIVSVILTIDSQGTNINATQGIVHFSEGVLQLSSVDRTGSIFNFWVEDPNISNNVGTMNFTGGTTKGVSGSSLNVLTMKFKATGAGKASITFTDGAVSANDGLGTNVLATVNKADISVTGTVSAAVPTVTTPAPQPAPVIRTPVSTGKLPVKPTVAVSAYPDETQWYHQVANAVVFWNVPKDIIAVASSIDNNPNGVPSQFDKQLFDGKDFGILNEGAWYAHVRFKNTVGSGPVTTNKISLDITPPLPFIIFQVGGNQPSDEPSPTLNFETSDSLSGIEHYSVVIDNQQYINNTEGTLKLPPQAPGNHIVKVIAYDKAGNTAEALFDIVILPITSPVIAEVTSPLYSDTNDKLVVSGSAISNLIVVLTVTRVNDGFIVANGTARVDDKGQFAFNFEDHFDNGSYKVTARTQDDRGALSLPVESPFTVKSKPVLTIGFFELSFTGLIILLLLILMMSFVGGYYFYKFRKEKSERRTIIAKRDLLNLFDLLKKGIETMKKGGDVEDEIKKTEALKELEKNVNKLDMYIKKEVEGIGK